MASGQEEETLYPDEIVVGRAMPRRQNPLGEPPVEKDVRLVEGDPVIDVGRERRHDPLAESAETIDDRRVVPPRAPLVVVITASSNDPSRGSTRLQSIEKR